jgi:hypothetical protein
VDLFLRNNKCSANDEWPVTFLVDVVTRAKTMPGWDQLGLVRYAEDYFLPS